MTPVVRPLFTVADLEGKIVVSAEIAECDLFTKPCFYKGAGRARGSYIRVGDADLPMTEYEGSFKWVQSAAIRCFKAPSAEAAREPNQCLSDLCDSAGSYIRAGSAKPRLREF